MDVEKYKALVTALDCGSLSAAAMKLDYTTSGLSRMMASLEEEIGMKLFIRSKTGIRATAGCEELLPEIRNLIDSAERLQHKESEMQGTVSGTVRIGTAYSYYYEILSECIVEFKEKNPDVVVELVYGYSTELAEKLGGKELDLCVISKREVPCRWISVKKDEMLAVLSASNPLAEKKSIPISAFAAAPYIYTHPGSDSDSARLFQKYGVVPNTRYTTEDSLATISMVKADLGITLNNKLNTDVWENGGVVTRPLRPRQRIDIGLAVSEEADETVLSFASVLMEAMRCD